VRNTEIEFLINLLSQLPGLGPRSARRAALFILSRKKELLNPLNDILSQLKEKIIFCETCFTLSTSAACDICSNTRRIDSILCVVEETTDVWALERAQAHKGLYHVLGGALNALEGITPADLNIEALIKRVENNTISEIILATNATLEGQATAHYLAERLSSYPIKLSRLARGLPLGSALEYMDDGTIADAMRGRRPF
jgi:recombination protein RecR